MSAERFGEMEQGREERAREGTRSQESTRDLRGHISKVAGLIRKREAGEREEALVWSYPG